MNDFTVAPHDFGSTEVTIFAKTAKAKRLFAERFGAGCVSITVLKSAAQRIIDEYEALGYTLAVV